LRRGFKIEKDQRCLLVEDVVTTGLSSRECMDAARALGGHIVAAAALVDRSGGRAEFSVPFIPLIRLDIPHFAPDQLPAAIVEIPPIKPGSRGLKT
jgi:orotate phosphoribosyltransferase